MPRIDGSAGPIPVSSSSTSSNKCVATVQLGESKLSEVAQRLGVDQDSLHKANPHIADPANLKVGQELNLPQFQAAQTLKLNDERGLQSQSSQSSLPQPPLGDSLEKSAMQARLSASDLSQVPGGARQIDSQHMKFEDKVNTTGSSIKGDKWSKADKSVETFKYAGASKAFQKADDLAQVAGGAGHADLQQMKEAGKAIHAGQPKNFGKVIDANQAIKMDKTTDPGKGFGKIDKTTKIFETTQDVTINKSKVANKAADKMDDYLRQ